MTLDASEVKIIFEAKPELKGLGVWLIRPQTRNVTFLRHAAVQLAPLVHGDAGPALTPILVPSDLNEN